MTEDGKRNGREKANNSKKKRVSKKDQGDLRVNDAIAIVRMEVEVEILATKQAEAEAEARRKANKKKRGIDHMLVTIEGDKGRKTGGKARGTLKPKSKGKKHSKGKFQKKKQLGT
ncbi:hypothetical protein PILCRDRAFT_827171 [Piloderma croceum F 1598]|uniref:Uncharacterized protein n=1 Tax=Piloderma croceum (strain F 1598) TaxID=765440 RepID=A0A0C3F640_PILCF|nr:hypothetical protein PILCRDRAFT_827171 [Piloderma croceum F 1598]